MKRPGIKSPVNLGPNLVFLRLKRRLNSPKTKKELYETIVNVPFRDKSFSTALGLGFLSLVLVNEKSQTIDRIAISKTETAQGAIDVTVKPFQDLIIPIDSPNNAVAKAVKTKHVVHTNDWNYLLTPVLKPEEARLNQAAAGIAHSYVYPLTASGVRGAIIYQYYVPKFMIKNRQINFMGKYTNIVSRELEKRENYAARDSI